MASILLVGFCTICSFLFARLSLKRIAQYGGWKSKPNSMAPYQQIKMPIHKKRLYIWTGITYLQISFFIEICTATFAEQYHLKIQEWISLSYVIPLVCLPIIYGIIYHHNLPRKEKELIPIDQLRKK